MNRTSANNCTFKSSLKKQNKQIIVLLNDLAIVCSFPLHIKSTDACFLSLELLER